MNTKGMDFDLIVTEGLAGIAAPTTSEEEFKMARHPSEKDYCPSIPQLEKIAQGHRSVAQWLHTNTCAYCQKSVTMFQELLGIKPWWQTLRETAQQFGETAEEFVRSLFQFPIPVMAGAPGERSVQAKVVFDLTSKPTTINVRDFEFVPGGLWLLVQWQELMEEIGRPPMDLTVVGGNERQIFGPFLLPGLSAGERQELLIALPREAESEWKERIEATETLPFNFILRPCADEGETHGS